MAKLRFEEPWRLDLFCAELADTPTLLAPAVRTLMVAELRDTADRLDVDAEELADAVLADCI